MASEFENSVKDEAEATARRAAARVQATAESVGGEAQRTADAVKSQFAATAEKAKRQVGEVADAAKERARAIADDQKAAGADQLSGLARAIEHAADELQSQLPQAADIVRAAATKIDNVSTMVRERSVDELAGEVTRFARANTVAFFGLSLAAGFALSRFLKSRTPVPPATSEPVGEMSSAYPLPAADSAIGASYPSHQY